MAKYLLICVLRLSLYSFLYFVNSVKNSSHSSSCHVYENWVVLNPQPLNTAWPNTSSAIFALRYLDRLATHSIKLALRGTIKICLILIETNLLTSIKLIGTCPN